MKEIALKLFSLENAKDHGNKHSACGLTDDMLPSRLAIWGSLRQARYAIFAMPFTEMHLHKT